MDTSKRSHAAPWTFNVVSCIGVLMSKELRANHVSPFVINPLTPRTFCQKHSFWTFWRFSGWIWAKLAPIDSKRHLQHDSMLFFPLTSCFMTCLLAYAQKSKFWESDILRLFVFLIFFFRLSFFSFSYLFAAVIDLLLGLLPVQYSLRKHRWDRQFLPWSSHV